MPDLIFLLITQGLNMKENKKLVKKPWQPVIGKKPQINKPSPLHSQHSWERVEVKA